MSDLSVWVLVGVGIVMMVVLLIFANKWEREACEAKGGRIYSRTITGIGVGVSGNGQVSTVPTTSTVTFCISEDGRIIR